MSAVPMTKASTPEPLAAAQTDTQGTAQAKSPEPVVRPNPEVVAKTDRRRFTAAYKRSILEQAERCRGDGEIGALLRREGLYSSHLSNWRRAQRNGTLASTTAQSRGPKASADAAAQREIARLQAQNRRLENDLKKAHTIIDVQKKLSDLLSNEPGDKNS